MGDVVLLVNMDDLSQHIPDNAHRIFVSAVKENSDTSSIFLRCTVRKRWPTQKTRKGSLMKITVADGDHDLDSINCFLVGDVADHSDVVSAGDTVLLSQFFVENNTNPAASNHSCQIILDKRRGTPFIVIVHERQSQKQPEPVASGSGSSQVRARTKGTPNKASQSNTQTHKQASPTSAQKRIQASPTSARTHNQASPPSVQKGKQASPISVRSQKSTRNKDNMDHSVRSNKQNTDMSRDQTTRTSPIKQPSPNRAAAAARTTVLAPPAAQQGQPSHTGANTAPTGRVQGPGPRVAANYTYAALKDLVRDTTVNVYGVIKFIKQPCRTRGTDYMMLVSVVDPSLDSLSHKLKCLLFAREQGAFPAQAEVGDVIRMHRLKISEYNGELQGKNGAAFSFLVFDGAVGASLTPKFHSTNHYTITEHDYDQVTELREWWDSVQLQDPEEDTSLPRSLTLADVQCGSYFDLTCQVVAVCAISPHKGCLLKVWDGTKTSVTVHDIDTGDRDLQIDASLAQLVEDYTVDVSVFDNHYERGSYCEPGDYIKLFNLHALKHKGAPQDQQKGVPQDQQKGAPEDQHSAVPTVELCLHGGTSYGRGLRIHEDTDQQIQALKNRLEDLKETLAASSSANKSPPQRVTRSSLAAQKTPLGETTNQQPRRSPRIRGQSSRKRVLEGSPSTSSGKRRSGPGAGTGAGTSDSNDIPQCMINTASVILGHHHIPHSSIRDVLIHSVPYKFRVRVRLMDYQPRATTARDLLKLYCPRCHYLSPLPESKVAIDSPESWAAKCCADTVENGIPLFNCPSCRKRRNDQTTERRMLQYIYMFQLIMYDGSGWLVAQLMKDEAVVFFDTPAEELVRSRRTFQRIQAALQGLSPTRGRDKQRPLLEVCLKSYSTPTVGMGTSYQVFDTCLATEEGSM